MGISAALLAQLAQGSGPSPLATLGTSFLQARAQRNAQRKEEELTDLKIRSLRREEERATRVQNILVSSVVDGEFDSATATSSLEKAGYVDEATKLKKQYSEQTKSALEINKLIQDIGQEQVKSMADQQQLISSRFGSLLLATDESMPSAYQKAVNDLQDVIPANAMEMVQSATDTQSMRDIAKQLWFSGGTFSSQANFLLEKEALADKREGSGEKPIGSNVYATQILKRMVDNRKNGRNAEFGISPEEAMAVDRVYGKDRVNAAYQILSSRPDFFEQMRKNPNETAKSVVDAATAIKAYEKNKIETDLRTRTQDPNASISATEIRQLKEKGMPPEKLKALMTKYNKTARQIYEDVMSRKKN